jgi:glycerophosphoryl diester phosphodiesterase
MSFWGMAHRGNPSVYPENTLASFESAAALQISHLELDVHLSKDGVPVVMHDPTIDRVCDGKGRIKDFTLEELKRFRIKGSEPIPTLEEALLLVKGRMIVDVELKPTGDYYTGMEQAVWDVIRKTDMVDQVVISAFDHYALVNMRKLSGDIRLAPVISGCTPSIFAFLEEWKMDHLSIKHNFLTDWYYRECMERGLQVIAWTVDAEEDMRRMLEFPSILVLTNYPERWIAVSNERK